MPPKVLFPVVQAKYKSYEELLRLPLVSALRKRGAEVEAFDYRDEGCPLDDYTHIIFLLMWGYHLELEEIELNFRQRLMPLQKCVMMNPSSVILWNMDKAVYLPDLEKARFPLPHTEYLALPVNLDTIKKTLLSGTTTTPVVLKPSISASSYLTVLVQDPSSLTDIETASLSEYTSLAAPGILMIQEFISEIQTAGEISVVMIDGKVSHGVEKHPPPKDFRSQPRFKGLQVNLKAQDTPRDALKISREVWTYVCDRFQADPGDDGKLAYARIDGVMQGERFVLMEVELFEPALWLQNEEAKEGLDRLCDMILKQK